MVLVRFEGEDVTRSASDPPLVDQRDAIADWLRNIVTRIEGDMRKNRCVKLLGDAEAEHLGQAETDGGNGRYFYDRAATEFTLIVRVEPGDEHTAANELSSLAYYIRTTLDLTR